MDARFGTLEQDDNGRTPESQPESPTQFGSLSEITKVNPNTNSSHRKSSKAVQKRVVSIPIKDSEGTRFKGEGASPPSDSWAWRKYGQKPIKGSPYPRGYYRCSSSKGCPARKQVERSQDDPTMLVVTYSREHNHPWPAPKNNPRSRNNNHNSPAATTIIHEEEKPENINAHSSPDPEPGVDVADEFSWFMDMRTTPSTILESPIFGEDYYHHHRSYVNYERKSSIGEADMAMFFPMREEDESLFSDLGELPECAVVFNGRQQ